MRKVESIKDLKGICQESKKTDAAFYEFGWFERYCARPVSIYFTRVFLRMRISANQVTLTGLLVGIGAGILLIFGSAQFWVIGALLLYLSVILDHADGEVARYNRTFSAEGEILDAISDRFLNRFVLTCACLGIYNVLHEIVVLVLGFAGLILLFLCEVPRLLAHIAIAEREGQPEYGIVKLGKSFRSELVRYGYIVFGHGTQSLLVGILVTSIIDCFLPPFTIANFLFDFRFIYVMAYIGALVVAAIVLTNILFRRGLTHFRWHSRFH
jgi:phosphatidylglycerophosphate synthase